MYLCCIVGGERQSDVSLSLPWPGCASFRDEALSCQNSKRSNGTTVLVPIHPQSRLKESRIHHSSDDDTAMDDEDVSSSSSSSG
jgi:hypothetical protein